MEGIKNPVKFSNQFVKLYLQEGMGRLQKRDIEILVLHLMIEDGQYTFPDDIFRACRDLRLTETRLRNLYQDVQLRYKQIDEEGAKRKLVDIVKNQSFKITGERITFIVRDPMMGQFFQEWVAKAKGFTDSSFNKNLVTVDQHTFEKVITDLAVDKIGEFPKEANTLNKAKSRPALFSMFAEEFMKSAGKTAGELSVQGAAAALSIMFGL